MKPHNIHLSARGEESLHLSGCGSADVRSVVNKAAVFIAAALFAITIPATPAPAQTVGAIERLDPPALGFFSKRLLVCGIPILAHADVNNKALEEAARRMDKQLARAPEIAANLCALGAEMHIIGKNQKVSDLPQYRHLKGKPFGEHFGEHSIDKMGRGFGGLYPCCPEENLLGLPSDLYPAQVDICSHEFAHAILRFGVSGDIQRKVEAQYRQSVAAGKWKTMYAATNVDEFFAELSTWYFGNRGDYGQLQPPPKPGRHWLLSYDPEAYELLDDIYGGKLRPRSMEVLDLPALPSHFEGQIRSMPDQPATWILFINKTARQVKLFWLNLEGKRKSDGEVPPGDWASRSTFATYAWLVEDESGKCLGIHVADKKIGRVIIAEERTK